MSDTTSKKSKVATNNADSSTGGTNAADMCTLFVTGIPKNLNEPEKKLTEIYEKVGDVTVKINYDYLHRKIAGHGNITFKTPAIAKKALETLNFYEVLPGCELQLTQFKSDPASYVIRESNILLKNLPPSMTLKKLNELGREFGEVISVKFSNTPRNAAHFGYIQFKDAETAKIAIDGLDERILDGCTIAAERYISKDERIEGAKQNFTQVYMKNIREDISDSELRSRLQCVGEVTDMFVKKPDGRTTKYALITMATHEDAENIIANFNKSMEFATPEEPLVANQLRSREEKLYKSSIFDGRSIYVKNLSVNSTEELIRHIFEQFGVIENVSMHRDQAGNFQGVCIIRFDSRYAARKAINQLHGSQKYTENSNWLYVQLAETKDRRMKKYYMEHNQAGRQQMYSPHMRQPFQQPNVPSYDYLQNRLGSYGRSIPPLYPPANNYYGRDTRAINNNQVNFQSGVAGYFPSASPQQAGRYYPENNIEAPRYGDKNGNRYHV